MVPTSLMLLVFFVRVAYCQNIETYRYDVANLTRHISSTSTTTNVTIDASIDKLNGNNYDETVTDQDFIEAPSNYVELSSKMQKLTSPREKKYIPICCKPGLYLIGMKCTSNDLLPVAKLELPPIYDSSLSLSQLRGEELIPKYGIPCAEWDDIHPLLPAPIGDDVFFLLENGTIFHDYSNTDYDNVWYNENEYCWANVIEGNRSTTLAAVCFGFPEETKEEETISKLKTISMILSLPFFLATFVTYSILPELKTMHGSTLRTYVACLFVAYTVLSTVQWGKDSISSNSLLCLSLAFVIHFSFLASFFWLNVMCFDIWWTFGGFRSLQGSVRQRERKKFIIYSAYAWGSAWILTGLCMIMDLVPGVPSTWIRPEFGVISCWFRTDPALALYFYGPMGLTVLCNICLFISTALKIKQHKKDTAHHLKGTDSRRHDDNKQWFVELKEMFNLYLKLFIVMGINWSMEIVSWFFKNGSPSAVWYLTDLANTLQGVIIFVIFVWKNKIKRLLLKRLGFRERNLQSGNSTRSGYHSSASRTCTTSGAAMAPLQEKSNPYAERPKITTDDSDCV